MPPKQTRKKRTPPEKNENGKPEGIQFLNRLLGFKHFLASGFEPKIADAEIIVCFADVRGFTSYCRKLQKEMQDRKIQNFLRDYFKIFTEGLVSWGLALESDGDDTSAELLGLEKYVIPTMYKNLGDGLMMVWEIPPGLGMETEGNIARQILTVIACMEEQFYFHFRNLDSFEIDAYSQEVTTLEIGFGITKGHAWRLDFGHSVDYAGSIINLASRLSSVARPRGIVAHYDVSTWMFDELVKEDHGKIQTLNKIKGYEPGIKVWIDNNVSIIESGDS